jgi:hypothetical protein
MSLKRVLLIPPELIEKKDKQPPPPLQEILKQKGRRFDKWARLRPYLRSEKKKREPIPIPILETGGTHKKQPRYKIERRKRRTLPIFKTTDSRHSEPECSLLSERTPHSKYTNLELE